MGEGRGVLLRPATQEAQEVSKAQIEHLKPEKKRKKRRRDAGEPVLEDELDDSALLADLFDINVV